MRLGQVSLLVFVSGLVSLFVLVLVLVFVCLCPSLGLGPCLWRPIQGMVGCCGVGESLTRGNLIQSAAAAEPLAFYLKLHIALESSRVSSLLTLRASFSRRASELFSSRHIERPADENL